MRQLGEWSICGYFMGNQNQNLQVRGHNVASLFWLGHLILVVYDWNFAPILLPINVVCVSRKLISLIVVSSSDMHFFGTTFLRIWGGDHILVSEWIQKYEQPWHATSFETIKVNFKQFRRNVIKYNACWYWSWYQALTLLELRMLGIDVRNMETTHFYSQSCLNTLTIPKLMYMHCNFSKFIFMNFIFHCILNHIYI